MKEFSNFLCTDDSYYFVLSYLDEVNDLSKKVCDMTKEEFLEKYDKAVLYNRNKIMNNNEYYTLLTHDEIIKTL